MIGRPIRPETAATMRQLLTGVTELGGTARRAAVENYTIAGKTGTAQMSVPGGYSSTDYWASFVGFCPAETPEFGMIIVIQRPRQIHTGGAVAAPAFGRIAQDIAHYLEIPADNMAVP
jgi:cell division protein FtsI/penicillin-binding protein 2